MLNVLSTFIESNSQSFFYVLRVFVMYVSQRYYYLVNPRKENL